MRFKKQYAKSSEISKGLQKLFSSSDIEILAQESEFVKRPSPMTGHKFAHLCIGGISEKGQLSTLTELCVLGMKALDVTLVSAAQKVKMFHKFM